MISSHLGPIGRVTGRFETIDTRQPPSTENTYITLNHIDPMVLPEFGSSLRRDCLVGLLAIGLLTAPLWGATLHIGEPTYTYDRIEVTTTDTGIEYVNPDDVPSRTPISDSIECAGWSGDVRACAFEEHLLEGGVISTGVYATNPNTTDIPSPLLADYYRYVQVDGEIYEPSYTANTSVQRDDGMYRVDLSLESAEPEDVLYWVSLGVDSDRVPPAVAEAAQDGHTTTRENVDVPETPIRLDDGTYYRVYQERGVDEPPTAENTLSSSLTYVAPLLGLYLIVRLLDRIEVSYVGKHQNDE